MNQSPLSRIVSDVRRGDRPSLEAIKSQLTGQDVLTETRKSPLPKIALILGALLLVWFFFLRRGK